MNIKVHKGLIGQKHKFKSLVDDKYDYLKLKYQKLNEIKDEKLDDEFFAYK